MVDMRHRRDDPSDALPSPNKDIAYGFYVGRSSAREFYAPAPVPRPRYRCPADLLHKPGTPLLWGDEPWPTRRPMRFDARVGDVLAGNVRLRATCACGHSAHVDPEALRRRFPPTEMLKHVERYVRCRQCGRYGTASLEDPA